MILETWERPFSSHFKWRYTKFFCPLWPGDSEVGKSLKETTATWTLVGLRIIQINIETEILLGMLGEWLKNRPEPSSATELQRGG
jgi:hypothetical protein